MSESITVREDKETVFDSALRFPCKCAPETLPEPARLRRCVEHCSAHVLTARAETTRGCLHVQPVKSEICSTARGRGPFFGKRAARLVPTPFPNHKTANPASHVIPMRTVRRSDHVIPPPDSPPSRTKHQAPSPASDETAIQKRRFTAKTRSPPLFRTPRGSTATGRCASAPACFRRTGRGRRPRVPPPRSAPA